MWAERTWLAVLLWKCHRSEQSSGSDLGLIEEEGFLFEDCSHPGFVFVLFIYLFLCFVSVSSPPCASWPGLFLFMAVRRPGQRSEAAAESVAVPLSVLSVTQPAQLHANDCLPCEHSASHRSCLSRLGHVIRGLCPSQPAPAALCCSS